MSLILDGTNGLSDVDGTAAAPAIRGTDANTGIFFPAADTIAFAEGGAEVARFDSAGNMGLGATPSAWGSNNRTIDMYGIGSFSSFSNGSGGTLDSSGNLLVGTTSGTGASERFALAQDNPNWIHTIRNSSASSPFGSQIWYTGSDPNNTSNFFFGCYGGGAQTLRMNIRSNGGIANYSANNSNLSDRREKTNFAPAKSYLDVICAIPVQTFNYIDQNLEEDAGLTLGIVAQDVQAVAPELVMESNWANKDETPKMRLSIYQTDLQYALMKCIQEQQALITALTTRITALEGAAA